MSDLIASILVAFLMTAATFVALYLLVERVVGVL